MSWLNDVDRIRIYNFALPDGNVARGTLKQLSELAGKEVLGEPGEVIAIDGVEASYAGFEPVHIAQQNSVEFEKNGIKALRVRKSDGTIQYVSKTRMHYQNTGQIKSQMTAEYQEAAEKNVQKELQALKLQKGKPDPLKTAIKGMPDGEYITDGKKFMPAENYKEEVNFQTATRKKEKKS